MAGAKFLSMFDGAFVLRGERRLISGWGGGEDESDDADRETAASIVILSFELAAAGERRFIKLQTYSSSELSSSAIANG